MNDERRNDNFDPRGEDAYIPRRVRVDDDSDDWDIVDEFSFERARHIHEQSMDQYEWQDDLQDAPAENTGSRQSGISSLYRDYYTREQVSQPRQEQSRPRQSAAGQQRRPTNQTQPRRTEPQSSGNVRRTDTSSAYSRATHLVSNDGALESLECDRVDLRGQTAAPAPAVRTGTKKKKKKKKYRQLKKWLKKIAVLMLVLLLLYFVVANIALSGINVIKPEDIYSDTPPQAVANVALRDPVGVTNLLILGIDGDGSSGSRSDTIMIASINHLKGTLKLCSILRDCYVEVPGHDSTKINHSYHYGGVALTRQTVENNFRVEFDGVVTVDMNSLVKIVDAIGGVTITITDAEARQINKELGTSLTEGTHLLTGAEAVYYSRIRKIDSDFARTGRQRVLISAILDKIKGPGALKLIANSSEIMSYVSTTLNKQQLSWLLLRSLPAISGDFEQMTVPADGTYSFKMVGSMSVISIDLDENVTLLHEFLFG